MTRESSNHNHWSKFWERGFITTFGPTMPKNYEPAIWAFWYKQFDCMRTGSVILDVAAGNGAIAIMAAKYAEERGQDFTIMATDAAQIHDNLNEESQEFSEYRKRIKFYSETPCEDLPFTDASVDLVCSQFGIEYSVLAVSLAQVARILKDGGMFSAIMHHSESYITSDLRIEQSILHEALDKHHIFKKLEQCFSSLGEVSDPIYLKSEKQNPQAAQAINELKDSLSIMLEKYPHSPIAKRIATEINNIFSAKLAKSDKERQAAIEFALSDLFMMIERRKDLESAAISPLMMKLIRETAEMSGLSEFVAKEIQSNNSKVGWAVNARKF